MDEKHETEGSEHREESPAAERTRIEYEKPALRELGNVEELTRGTAGYRTELSGGRRY